MRVVGPDEHPTEVPRVPEVQYVEQNIYVQSIYVWLYYFSTCTYYYLYPRNTSAARTLYIVFNFQDNVIAGYIDSEDGSSVKNPAIIVTRLYFLDVEEFRE